jgi:predicted DNA-binding transcriptional regulator AlpA
VPRHHLDRHAGAIIVEAANGDHDDLLTTPALAALFRVSKQWLEIGRSKGYGPPFIRLAPQVVRYRRGDVQAWLAERQYAHTADYDNG